MKTEQRIPQAPRQPLPELAEFLGQFQPRFAKPKRSSVVERYLTGLLTEHPNKNCQTMAAVVPATNEQQLNNLLTEMQWDEEDLNRQRVKCLSRLKTEGDGILVIDDTGFAKKGDHSVGVAPQYSGTLGKVANCQVAVNCHYAEPTLAWPVNTRLYLPKAWAEDPERRAQAHVPKEVTFLTKPEIGLALLDQATGWGVPHAGVTADAGYGDNPNFLNGLEGRHEHYVVGINKDFSVATGTHGPAQSAQGLLDAVPRRQWWTYSWREGTKGKLRARFVVLRAWRVDGDGTHHIGWLIGQKSGRAATLERKYFWSNFGPRARPERLIEYAHRRYWIEQYHEEAKGLLGWDQFQGRRWDGFHRNAVLMMLSYSFLVWQEWRERQARVCRGRRRRAFSPSARPAAAFPAQPASAGGRLAPNRGQSRNSPERTVGFLPPSIDLTK